MTVQTFIGLGDVYRSAVKNETVARIPGLSGLFDPRNEEAAFFEIVVAEVSVDPRNNNVP
jgi:hypothetical protein